MTTLGAVLVATLLAAVTTPAFLCGCDKNKSEGISDTDRKQMHDIFVDAGLVD